MNTRRQQDGLLLGASKLFLGHGPIECLATCLPKLLEAARISLQGFKTTRNSIQWAGQEWTFKCDLHTRQQQRTTTSKNSHPLSTWSMDKDGFCCPSTLSRLPGALGKAPTWSEIPRLVRREREHGLHHFPRKDLSRSNPLQCPGDF